MRTITKRLRIGHGYWIDSEENKERERNERSGVRRRPPPPPELSDELHDQDLRPLVVSAAPPPAEPLPAPVMDPYEPVTDDELFELAIPMHFPLPPRRRERKTNWLVRIFIGVLALAAGAGVASLNESPSRVAPSSAEGATAAVQRQASIPLDIAPIQILEPIVVVAEPAPLRELRRLMRTMPVASELIGSAVAEAEEGTSNATPERADEPSSTEVVFEEPTAEYDLPSPIFRPRRARRGSALDAVDRALGNVSDAPPAPAFPVAPPALEEPSTPTRDQVTFAMEGARPEVLQCSGGRHGVVQVQLTVSPAGRVLFVRVTGSFAGTAEGSCIARVARSLTFPAFEADSFVVRYPYQL